MKLKRVIVFEINFMMTYEFKESNLLKVSFEVIKHLGIKLTKTTFKRVIGEDDSRTTLADISEAFEKWNIKTAAVRLKNDQLKDIEFPSISYMNDGESYKYFVMISKIKDDEISYYDANIGYTKEKIDIFLSKWTGVVLLIEAEENSGEENYKINRRKEITEIIEKCIPMMLMLLCYILTMSQKMTLSCFFLVNTKLLGAFVSVNLILKENGTTNTLIEKLCNVNVRADCTTVINSSASKLFNKIPVADIGLIYFMGSLFAILLSILTKSQSAVIPILAVLNVVSLPYTVFSTYYQGYILKKWCPLCMIIQVLLWIEFALNFSWLNYIEITNSFGLLVIIFCFSMSILLLITYKPIFKINQRSFALKREISSFRENVELFKTLLQNEPSHDMQFEENEILIGNLTAPVTITMISGPFCSPCGQTHNKLFNLLNEYPDAVRIIVRFAVNLENHNDLGKKMARHMLSLAKTKPALLPNALSSWYETRNLRALENQFPVIQDDNTEDKITRQAEWNKRVGIQVTPTVFINNQLLPKYFQVNDLEYHMKFILRNNLEEKS